MRSLVAIALLLGIVVTANFFYATETADTIKITSNNCDLQKESCMVSLTEHTNITFSINPKPIPLLKQLVFNAKLNGIEANELKVDIVGANMNMGVSSYKLKKIDSGEFTGSGALGACVVHKMQWLAKVNIKTKKENYLVSFPFTTIKN